MSFLKKEQQEDLCPEREMLAVLVSRLEEGVIIYDSSFRIVSINPSAEEILGVRAGDIVDNIFSLDKAKNFKPKVFAEVMFPLLAPTVSRKSDPGSYPQVLDILTEDPAKNLRITIERVGDDFVKIIKDQTRESELLKTKSEFITMAAHQLRTPATGLKWALENPDKESLNIARKTAGNLLEIINDLIDLAQMEEGRFDYKFEKINLVDFLGKVLAEAELVAREYQVNLYFKPPANKGVFVKADLGKLAAAVSNLVDNAIKYNVKNGEVVVSAGVANGKAKVSVKDTGFGMDKEELPKLFTKFYRGKDAVKRNIAGSGLGLYLAKNIIEQHSGQLKAESVPNRGSVFSFSLPIA